MKAVDYQTHIRLQLTLSWKVQRLSLCHTVAVCVCFFFLRDRIIANNGHCLRHVRLSTRIIVAPAGRVSLKICIWRLSRKSVDTLKIWKPRYSGLLGYYAASSGNSLPKFRDNLSVWNYRRSLRNDPITRKNAVLINFAAEARNYAKSKCG